MGDLRVEPSDIASLLEQLLAQRSAPASLQSGYDELRDLTSPPPPSGGNGSMPPDPAPQDVCVGVSNVWALAEAMLGRRIDRTAATSSVILSNVLQTDYDEMFDMHFGSVLYAGLTLDGRQVRARRLSAQEMHLLEEGDLETPDLSCIQHVDDLERIGIKDLGKARVKTARLQNGKLMLIVEAAQAQLGRTLSNRQVTQSVRDLVTPFRRHGDSKQHQGAAWMPPNSTWRDPYKGLFERTGGSMMKDLASFRITERTEPTSHEFDDPVQGCATDCWFVAALFSVFWADPACINRATTVYSDGSGDEGGGKKWQKRCLAIKFHDKGGRNNSKTDTVTVDYEIPMANCNNLPLYCRSSDAMSIWPSLYEKAFAKWIAAGWTSIGGDGIADRPDMTQLHSGDPIKAMAQINGREPLYWECAKHDAADLLGLVRRNCVNSKTINPMAAWTKPTGPMFKGCNLVANHSYSVLGYAVVGETQVIVLRNPWGVTEPEGMSISRGLMLHMDPSVWYPAAMVDKGGVFGIEPKFFKECFEFIGVAKEEKKQ